MPVLRLSRVDTTKVVSGAGCLRSAVAGGIASEIVSGINDGGTVGGLATTVAGGFQLGGGSTDYPAFSSNRTRTFTVGGENVKGSSAAVTTTGTLPTNWNPIVSSAALIPPSGGFLTNQVNAATAQCWVYLVPLPQTHNGATLNTATLFLAPNNSHGALPAVMPQFSIGVAQVSTTTAISFAAPQVDPTGTVGVYNTIHSWSITVNTVIDNTQFMYYLIVWDEASTNALSGNNYRGVKLNYNNIADMKFQ